MRNIHFNKLAKVKYMGAKEKNLTPDKIYDAFFVEYWQGTRNSLHIRDDSGQITDFHPREEFEIIEDPDDVLTLKEAIVECITNRFDGELFGIRPGKQYKAIGRDRNGMFLVMDESLDCYFYPSDFFVVVEDEHGILERKSIYYSYR